MNSREERILMATQKEICAANSASCEELTHFVNSLNEKQLGTAMPAGWTVSGVLCHLVYWDFRAITLLKQWQSTGITPTPNDFDLVNEAMDIDHFKEINDQFGHQAGDSILQQFGQAILQATRDSDYSFRLGGDEVLVAFPGMTIAEAKRKANLFRETLQSIVIERDNARVSTTVSIGIAEYPTHGDNVQVLINRADRALYRAKEKGRNQVLVADLSMQEG